MTRRAWILMLALAALWGASYMFIHIALDDGVPAPVIVWARIALGALALSLLGRSALRELRGHWGKVSAIGLVHVAAPFLLITYGQRWIPSSLAAILVASAPIFIALLAPRMHRADALGPWGIVGVTVGILGVAVLFGVDLSGEATLALGGAMVLLASLGYAFGSIWVRRDLSDVAPVAVAAGTMISSSAMTLIPALIAAPSAGEGAGTLGALAAIAVLGVGGTGVAFLLYYVLIADIGASRASVVAYLAPGFAVVYGALFLDEAITATTLAGLALILAGCWVAAEGRPPWARFSRGQVPAPARISVAPEPAPPVAPQAGLPPVAPDPALPGVAPDPAAEDQLSRSGPSRSTAPSPARGR